MIRLAALAAALLLSVPAWAADELKGVALVIGESKYESLSELVNPNRDARDIDNLLGDLGFEVDRVLNADAEELREAIENFIEDAADADVALVYYSGHGIEVAGENYLVPVDADFASPEAAGEALVAVGPMLDALAKAVPVTIVLLDACRSDPFPVGTFIQLPGSDAPVEISEQPGLVAVRGPTPTARPDLPPDSLGTVIGFAAEPGEPALDGPAGENSPYAAALIKHLSAGGFSFGDVMTMVTEEVYLKTRAQQLPWTNSSLRRVLTFAAPDEGDADETAITGERRKLLLTIAGTPAETRAYVEALAGEEDVPLDALYGMLNVLGVKVTDAGGDLEQQLQKGAEKLKELISQKSTAVKADPELERLSQLAEAAEQEGAIALALDYRNQASAHADDLLSDKLDEAEKLRQDMIDIAHTYAANAATALINFDHARAAELYGKAYAAVEDWDPAMALEFKLNEGDAFADLGYYRNDNAAMTASIDAYHAALGLAPRDTAALVWAKLQDRLGQASQTLGQRLSDPTTLEASTGFYAAALEVRTRDAHPADWARTQNNLGNALYTLGERQGDRALIRRSVEAFDNALSIITPEAEPVRWATVASNRGASQISLAELIYMSTNGIEMAAMMAGVEDPTTLPEVVAAREEALVELDAAIRSLEGAVASSSRADNPFDWAMLKHTLAGGVQRRAELFKSAEDMQRAIGLYREALEVHTLDKTPAQWVRSANNLAISLKKLTDFTADPAPLREAVATYRAVIEATPRADLPLDWGDYQKNLGQALAGLAEYEDAVPNLDAALQAFAAAGEVTTLDRGVAKWKDLQNATSMTLLMHSMKSFDVNKAIAAKDLGVATRDKLRELGAPDDTYYEMFLGMTDQVIELFPK
ncbi:MAG: caspase family protein [Hyphomicrobiales bacterium]|nr:MAG: caspase family protein [Hyphomicrobiales bacterium]